MSPYRVSRQSISMLAIMFKFIRLAKVILYALAGFLLAVSETAHASFETIGGKITESDKLLLPPVCRLILFEKPSAHQGEGQITNAALFNRPEYRMAKNNIHLHHYCYGLLSKHRYFISFTRGDREKYANNFQGELNYVLERVDKDWPYSAQLYFEKAEMFFYTDDLTQAVSNALHALTITPGYVKAHALLSDIYVKIGKRDMALKQLHDGLAITPSSKTLLGKLRELDPKDPLLTQPLPEPIQSSETPESEQTSTASSSRPLGSEERKPSPEQVEAPLATDSSPGTPDQDKPVSKPPDAPNPTNPYCRFCP